MRTCASPKRVAAVPAWMLVCIVTVSVGLGGCQRERGPAPFAAAASLPEYVVLSEETYDVPGKTQVKQDVLVATGLSEASVRELLSSLYASVMDQGGFRYHDPPTNVYIYVFDSRALAESRVWIAMLQKHYQEAPLVRINARWLERAAPPVTNRFGLTEQQRRDIWREVLLANREAADECYRLYRRDMDADYECLVAAGKRVTVAVAEKYALTEQQVEAIDDEAFEEMWLGLDPR